MRYQPEIDGLRALAVLPVLFFHSGWAVFSGGYVGVDVFFVISGYLITGILAAELADNRFSILNFYERRIRRIMPCLLAVIITSGVAAMLLLVPLDFRDFAKSAVATLFFASNILFFRQSGYFDDASEMKPMLHTWSLAVEEQYYIFFPILLWLIHRYARDRLFLVLAPLAVLSFAASVWGVGRAPAFTFFMAPTRVWELFAGALLALGLVPAIEQRPAREALSWAGLGLIVYAIVVFTESTRFPGLNALYPVIGAVLLIQFARGTSVGWLLSRKGPVFVGLISYSLYLWHWPIIVFAQYRLGHELSGLETLAAIAASLLAATVSWRYVERPFRVKGLINRRRIFQGAASVTAAVAALAVAGIASNGWAGRFPDQVARLEGYADAYSARREECHRDEGNIFPMEETCIYGADTPPTFAIWGDSHAIELSYAIGEVAGRHHRSVLQFTYSSCPPALGFEIGPRPNCRSYNDGVAAFLTKEHGISTVFLVAAYVAHDKHTELFEDGIRKTVALLLAAGKRIVLVYPIPTADASIPRTLARYAAAGVSLDKFSIDKRAYFERNAYAFKLLDSFSGASIVRVYPHERLCRGEVCIVQAGGTPLYYDKQHLSIPGAEYLAPLFEPVFDSAPITATTQPVAWQPRYRGSQDLRPMP
ncbi:MAG TPA: acyltransferase family protein [Dongiaceae bacterium]|nr:acyltransferase family protein [Dongiaceae bacterium]